MELTLDHTQRLNLHALMGAQRVSVDELRVFWRLQDLIDLTDEERTQIEYRMVEVNGISQPAWSIEKTIPPKTFTFTTDEWQRIEKMLKGWQAGFLPSADRRWLEPLLAHFDSNGQPKN